MPNRMLRDWTHSEKVDKLTVHAERFFTRLIMVVDDFGRFYANARLLKSHLFPLKQDTIRDTDISRCLDECQRAGLIAVYENSGKCYLQINEFNQRLRQKNEKYPRPDDSTLLTDVGQVTVNGQSIDGLNRIEDEEEEKRSHAHEFFKIEDCFTIALKDSRWVDRNKAIPEELAEFNRHLESKAIYQKKPDDYKSHFASWKKKEYKPQQAGSGQKTVNEFL